jgi:hydroxyisourate hydrolase
MAKLTTHVLNLVSGRPAVGVAIALFRGTESNPIRSATTNSDGRLDAPLLDPLEKGTYRIEFAVGAYFKSQNHPDAGKFLDIVPVIFIVDDPNHSYHVPLLVSPWAYSTYRGS